MGKHKVIERELNCPEYNYTEEFDTLEEAQKFMHDRYQRLVGGAFTYGMFLEARIGEKDAYMATEDANGEYNEIWWDILENQ